MRALATNEYALQSYFKSVCESFFVAYQQMKRLEEERKKLDDDDKENHQIDQNYDFWQKIMWRCVKTEILPLIVYCSKNDVYFIITNEQEIMALVAFYMSNSVEKVRIINEDEEFLKVYPKGKMNQEFLKIYIDHNEREMQEFCKKYF